MKAQQVIVNDVTRLNPVPVWAVTTPTSIEEVQDALRRTTGPIAVGGGRFSMGGQTASPGCLQLDMRRFNQVVAFSPLHKTIRVQTGIRWCDIQRFVDPHGLAVKIMQTYANFTVGGSLSVNVHGRYIGFGPLVLSVRAIKLVLPSAEVVEASPSQNSELFYGAIGGYGGLGVIVEAELDLADNRRVQRVQRKMAASEYAAWFRKTIRNDPKAIFHNADLYAPDYTRARAVSWVETDKPVTVPYRLQPHRHAYPLENYFLWAISETPLGKWRREYIIDPILYLRSPVHWRNFEAGYNVAELEPPSRDHRTYVLQEYFVPVGRFDEFLPRLSDILRRHRVNMLNVSVRHALPDPGTMLAWAREETFAFVLYYKQRTRQNARDRVAVWTRELIDAVVEVGGTYYLPYQPHATPEQFHKAYPRARELFALKDRIDPEFRFRNVLWDKYYQPEAHPASAKEKAMGEFQQVYGDVERADAFYRFLQNVYRIYPEDRFHTLIREACKANADDESVYRHIQSNLHKVKPFLSEVFYALPSLAKQKKEMTRQTLELLGSRREIDGYVEIGTTGRYISDLRKHLRLKGDLVLVNDVAPTNSPVDLVERGQVGKLGRFVPLKNYAPISQQDIPDASVDLVTCYIGLHHIVPGDVEGFIRSIHRIMRPGGMFILRDHDVTTPPMHAFVSLAHAVFNAGLGTSWEVNAAELRHFAPVADWIGRLAAVGLRHTGPRLAQPNDPSDNLLMAFAK
ncbi:MAG: FAD-binding protein [Betaproteobacteria bacterium]